MIRVDHPMSAIGRSYSFKGVRPLSCAAMCRKAGTIVQNGPLAPRLNRSPTSRIHKEGECKMSARGRLKGLGVEKSDSICILPPMFILYHDSRIMFYGEKQTVWD